MSLCLCGKPGDPDKTLPGADPWWCGDVRCKIENERLADGKDAETMPPLCLGPHKWEPELEARSDEGFGTTPFRERCVTCRRLRCTSCGQATISVWCQVQSQTPEVLCSACSWLGRIAT